jgi:hypothetical protein
VDGYGAVRLNPGKSLPRRGKNCTTWNRMKQSTQDWNWSQRHSSWDAYTTRNLRSGTVRRIPPSYLDADQSDKDFLYTIRRYIAAYNFDVLNRAEKLSLLIHFVSTDRFSTTRRTDHRHQTTGKHVMTTTQKPEARWCMPTILFKTLSRPRKMVAHTFILAPQRVSVPIHL